jgi:hypothetical protein
MFYKFTSSLFAASLSTLFVCSPVFSQDAGTNSTSQVVPPTGPDNPTIIPPHPEAIDGGNPFQGLGRSDDTGPSRWQQYLKPDGTSLPNPNDPANSGSVATPSSDNKPVETVPKLPSELTEPGHEVPKENALKETALEKKEEAKENETKKEETKKEEGLSAAKIEKDSPTRRALHALQTGHYEEALTKFKALSVQNAGDAQVHYLLAVTNVMLRKFPEASTQYKLAAKLAGPGSHLAELAEEGLRKLAISEKFGVQ